MKKFLIYLLIPIMLLQCNMTLIICTSFYYNQNFIEKYICVQRSMKNNTCHGQCYLMKKLKAQQDHEQANFKVNFHEAFVQSPELLTFTTLVKTRFCFDDYSEYNSNLFPKDFVSLVFHPPLTA